MEHLQLCVTFKKKLNHYGKLKAKNQNYELLIECEIKRNCDGNQLTCELLYQKEYELFYSDKI